MSPIEMSKLETSIRTVLAFHEARNRADQSAMLALVSEDCGLECPSPAPDGSFVSGGGAVVLFWLDFCPPGAHMEIEEIFGMGMRCVLRWKLIQADGVHLRGVDVVQLRNGLIWKMMTYVKGRPSE